MKNLIKNIYNNSKKLTKKRQKSLQERANKKGVSAISNLREKFVDQQAKDMEGYALGAMQYQRDLKIKHKRLQQEIETIEKAIEDAEGGNPGSLFKINLPVKYIPESVVRSMDLDWREIKI